MDRNRPNTDRDVSVQDIVDAIGWPYPTWIERDLYAREFDNADDVVKMFNYLGTAIDKSFANDTVAPSIIFKYWRKLKPQSRKEKPTTLKATVHEHPDFDKIWMFLEYA